MEVMFLLSPITIHSGDLSVVGDPDYSPRSLEAGREFILVCTPLHVDACDWLPVYEERYTTSHQHTAVANVFDLPDWSHDVAVEPGVLPCRPPIWHGTGAGSL